MSFILPESVTLVENKKHESHVYTLEKDKYILNNLDTYIIKIVLNNIYMLFNLFNF